MEFPKYLQAWLSVKQEAATNHAGVTGYSVRSVSAGASGGNPGSQCSRTPSLSAVLALINHVARRIRQS